ncbi:MAG TPA: SAM-dependent chlorinase/fluorinase [Gemmatimonadaceae bacterium]|nr:SAM-dependent chlorinase/fluorinase [Gemmatimonadaceae bacterium]
MSRVITLLTDFGTVDGYVGEMKGILLSSGADIEIVDITHDVPPQDVERARLTLARVWRRFPAGTIHIVVVDPGVGSARRGLAIASDEHFLIGPDNGVLSPALVVHGARVIELPVPPSASFTFHGRDVFAPAAAAIALGESIDEFGRVVDDPIIHRTPEPRRIADGAIEGQVIVVDRFGNGITNLITLKGGMVTVNGRAIPVRHTYAEVAPGQPVAVVGSTGFIEVAVRDGSAAESLGIVRGTKVILTTDNHPTSTDRHGDSG